VWLRLPDVPFTVIVNVPVAADRLVLRVRLLVPVAGLALNEAVVPLPMPLAERVTPPVNPPDGLIAMVLVPCEPRLMLRLAGDAESVKSPEADAFTVREIVVVCTREPDVPVIVTLTVPVEAVAVAFSVSVLVLIVGFGLKDAVTPDGTPVADSVTLLLKPFSGFTVIVLVPPVPPWVIVTLAGDADKLKFGDGAVPLRSLIKPEPFGLPQPVAKS
jgi:hypothetical protein